MWRRLMLFYVCVNFLEIMLYIYLPVNQTETSLDSLTYKTAPKWVTFCLSTLIYTLLLRGLMSTRYNEWFVGVKRILIVFLLHYSGSLWWSSNPINIWECLLMVTACQSQSLTFVVRSLVSAGLTVKSECFPNLFVCNSVCDGRLSLRLKVPSSQKPFEVTSLNINSYIGPKYIQ